MFFIATLSVIFHAFSILPGYAVGKLELVEVTDQEAVLVFLLLAQLEPALSLQLYKCQSVAQQSSLDLLVGVNVVERTRHELEVVGQDRLL